MLLYKAAIRRGCSDSINDGLLSHSCLCLCPRIACTCPLFGSARHFPFPCLDRSVPLSLRLHRLGFNQRTLGSATQFLRLLTGNRRSERYKHQPSTPLPSSIHPSNLPKMISLVYRAIALPFEISVYFWYLFWVIKRALFPPVPPEDGILSRIGSLATHAVIWPLEAIVLIWHLFWIITHKIFPHTHTAKHPYKPTSNGKSTGPGYTYPSGSKIPVVPKPYPSGGGGVSTGPVYPYPTGPKVPGEAGKPYGPGGVSTGPTYPSSTPPKVSEPHKPYTPNGSGTDKPTYTVPKVPEAPNPHEPGYGQVPTGPIYPGPKVPEAPKPTPPSGPGYAHPPAPHAPSSTTPPGPSDPASAEYLHGAQYIEPITYVPY